MNDPKVQPWCPSWYPAVSSCRKSEKGTWSQEPARAHLIPPQKKLIRLLCPRMKSFLACAHLSRVASLPPSLALPATVLASNRSSLGLCLSSPGNSVYSCSASVFLALWQTCHPQVPEGLSVYRVTLSAPWSMWPRWCLMLYSDHVPELPRSCSPSI